MSSMASGGCAPLGEQPARQQHLAVSCRGFRGGLLQWLGVPVNTVLVCVYFNGDLAAQATCCAVLLASKRLARVAVCCLRFDHAGMWNGGNLVHWSKVRCTCCT